MIHNQWGNNNNNLGTIQGSDPSHGVNMLLKFVIQQARVGVYG
jgi:hypothetical protein